MAESQWTRREFLELSLAGAGIVASAAAVDSQAATGGTVMRAIDGASELDITLRINGKDHQLRVDPRTTLLDCIRETVALTGTKKGCDHGQCGACTVHVNGRRVNSCLTLAVMHDGEEITTIEGLGTPDACIPCKRHSLPATDTSAAIARQARSCRPLHCSRNPAVPTTRR